MNYALVVSGKPSGLKHLNNTSKNVFKTLKNYSLFKTELLELEGVDKLFTKLSSLNSDYGKIDSFLFYYIGHGKVNFVDSSNRFEFCITDTLTSSLKDIILKIREHINPKKIFIIVDACKSGEILEDLHSNELNNVYLLSSSSKTELSYECDTLQSARFSAYFCKSFTSIKGNITFQSIEREITKKFENLDKEDEKQTVKPIDPHTIKNTLLAKPIKEELPPEDQELFLTIELVPVDNNNFNLIIWTKTEDGTYDTLDFSNDKTYEKKDIAVVVDDFIKEKYKDKPSSEITLIFVLPITLMLENIDSWKMGNSINLGNDYNILVRARERFRTEGINKDRGYYKVANWRANWKKYHDKNLVKIKDTHILIDSEEKASVNSRKIKDTPLIVIKHIPSKTTFLTLYKTAIPVALYPDKCDDFKNIEKLMQTDITIDELSTSMYRFKPDETGYKANIMLLYDNPHELPADENAPQYQTP